MNRIAIPLSRLWRPVTAVTAPSVVVLIGFAALGHIRVVDCAIAIVFILIGASFVIRLLLSDLAALREYAQALAQNGPPERRPRLFYSNMLASLLVSIRRLGGVGPGAQRRSRSSSIISGLDQLPDPVLMLDAQRRVVLANAPAADLLGETLTGRDLAAVLRNPVLLQAVDAVLGGTENAADVEFAFHVPVERHFGARIVRLDEPDENGIVLVLALHDVTEMHRSEEMRSDFIANASHELRTPISVLLGCVQTLRGSARDDPEAQAEFFGLMEGQAQRMSRLVDDLLALSRIELNEHTMPSEKVNLRDLLGQVRDTLALNAEAQDITVEIDVAGDVGPLAGDKEDLTKVFQNLMDNAIKYGAAESTVTVSARIAGQDLPPPLTGRTRYVAVSVADRGEGIAPDHLPRLTERFYRVDTAQSRRLGGTGLGLAIVKHAVNRHRGALTVDSVPGKGSTFTVYLPAPQKTAALPAPENAGKDRPGAENR